MKITLHAFLSGNQQVDPRLLKNLAQDLGDLGLETQIGSPLPIPAEAYNLPREQYRAEAFLENLHPASDEHLLGITGCDLYTGSYNFVFGLAHHTDKAAVISLARLVLDGDADTHRRRILKEAVHELGHTFGLGHCPDPGCVMHFSNSLADTDRKGSRFCDHCHSRLPAWVTFSTRR